ncbi:N-formylglutamate amidohydrolase [Desulfuromonas carbonis]|uniref:N-formylglutamate amidohydrolase n=1 Tax=Desulfuromonas sp. DDH964 TaxID=1823759 RepID=UPI00078D58B9|nr:N-formylglutamate amidohydrolase [Desulfuromonas sp. DDH964]AMV70811.1 hypothetical protein DBW_0409 [Desulfuromonas sp. DDH964]
MADMRLVLSCEHAGNQVPGPWEGAFLGHEALLETHRGYDIGIFPFAERLAAQRGVFLNACRVTRLLVDANRSPHSQTLFSEFSRALPAAARRSLLERYYHPYRQAVVRQVDQALSGGSAVLHLSLHSFTPHFRGVERNADVGLLYDPGVPAENRLCRRWQQLLRESGRSWRVRRNYPYRGAADSLVTWLRRRKRHQDPYLGIELEINQRWPLTGGEGWQQLQDDLLRSLDMLLDRPVLQNWYDEERHP